MHLNSIHFIDTGYLEGNASHATVDTLKQHVLDKTKYCQARREKMLAHVHDVRVKLF
jgi:hypothetical protein